MGARSLIIDSSPTPPLFDSLRLGSARSGSPFATWLELNHLQRIGGLLPLT
jgi:hypothetical protein